MADPSTTVATGTAAASSAVVAAGVPPQDVILWAVIGGLVSVWLSNQHEARFTLRWVAGALAQIGVAAVAGILLSAGVLAVAPAWGWLAPLASMPRWVLAGAIAALIFKGGPLIWRAFTGWSTSKGGTPNAQ